MKNKEKKISKLFVIAIIFLTLGLLFLFLENAFYNGLSDDGLLEESFFLPLGFIFITTSPLLLFIRLFLTVVCTLKKRKEK